MAEPLSIYASIFSIEDERQWIADMEKDGIKAGVIRDGDPEFDHLDAPIIYQGSHVMPDESDARGGSVGLAHIAAHVRFWRDNPDAAVDQEPDSGCEPYLRLDVQAHADTYGGGGDATVVLTLRQARRLRDALSEHLLETSQTTAQE